MMQYYNILISKKLMVVSTVNHCMFSLGVLYSHYFQLRSHPYHTLLQGVNVGESELLVSQIHQVFQSRSKDT